MKDRPLRLLSLAVACAAATLIGVAPASAQPPTPRPAASPAFSAYWVTVISRVSLYAGPEGNAPVFGEAPAGSLLQVVSAPQGRVRVFNPLNNGFAWIDPAAAEQTEDPSPEQIDQIANFEPWWAMTHKPAPAWSTEMRDAAQFGTVPMWRYLNVVSP